MNVIELWSIKVLDSSKNVHLSVFIELAHKARAVEKVLVKSQGEKISKLNEADDRTPQAERQDAAVITHDVIPGVQNRCRI